MLQLKWNEQNICLFSHKGYMQPKIRYMAINNLIFHQNTNPSYFSKNTINQFLLTNHSKFLE